MQIGVFLHCLYSTKYQGCISFVLYGMASAVSNVCACERTGLPVKFPKAVSQRHLNPRNEEGGGVTHCARLAHGASAQVTEGRVALFWPLKSHLAPNQPASQTQRPMSAPSPTARHLPWAPQSRLWQGSLRRRSQNSPKCNEFEEYKAD